MLALLVGVLTAITGQVEAPANSQITWQFPDGVITAVIPSGFQSAPLEQAEMDSFHGSRWTDEQTGSVIAAYQAPLPPERRNKPINMNELTKGFNDAVTTSVSGKLVQSSTETIDGFPMASMAASSNQTDLVVKQRMIVTSTMIYVLGATGTAKAQEEDPRLQQFLTSMKVQPSAMAPPLFNPVQQVPDRNQWNEIGGKIGFFGVVLLVICVVLARQSQHQPRKKKPLAKKKKPSN